MIPAGLDEMEPGPFLAAILSSIEVEELSGYERIVVLRALARMASHYHAHVYEVMASVWEYMNEIDDDQELAARAAAAEIRAALRLTRRAADAQLSFAIELRGHLSRLWEALSSGEVDVCRAKVIAHGTAHLPPETVRDVVERIIEDAPRLTTGQLRARIRGLCVEADPSEAKRRYEEAIAERRMVCEPTVWGTANLLGLELPPHRVAAVTRRITHLARSLRTADESRTMDQLRADIFLDLLLGVTTAERTGMGVVDISVDLETLAGLSDHPGELAGYGPVIADIARQVAEEQRRAEWRYTVTDSDTGRHLQEGTTRRRPAAGQRRAVEARDRTCVFPGCRMPATDCDLDHRILWSEGGRTMVEHLTPLCRHDHVTRHRAGWKHRRLPNGDHEWTTRLGHTYTTSGKPP